MTAQATPQLAPVHFLELEITGRCQLRCGHCYADSGPNASHGTMTTGDWENLLTSAPPPGSPPCNSSAANPPSTPTSSGC
ncbi:hypothetical protein ACWDLG_42715 [Nonomuraea sp. NPDC003727]